MRHTINTFQNHTNDMIIDWILDGFTSLSNLDAPTSKNINYTFHIFLVVFERSGLGSKDGRKRILDEIIDQHYLQTGIKKENFIKKTRGKFDFQYLEVETDTEDSEAESGSGSNCEEDDEEEKKA